MAKKKTVVETAVEEPVVEEAKEEIAEGTALAIEEAGPTIFRFDDHKELIATLVSVQEAPDNAVVRYRVTKDAPHDQHTAQVNAGVIEIHPNNVRSFLPVAPSFHYQAVE